MVCGLVGQAVANTAMLTRRALRAPDPDDDIVVSVPPLLKTALVWGLFMGVSANTRYQMVVGLERCCSPRLMLRRLCSSAPSDISDAWLHPAAIALRFAESVVGSVGA